MNTHFNWGKIYMQKTFAKVNNSKCPLHVITYDGMWVYLIFCLIGFFLVISWNLFDMQFYNRQNDLLELRMRISHTNVQNLYSSIVLIKARSVCVCLYIPALIISMCSNKCHKLCNMIRFNCYLFCSSINFHNIYEQGCKWF